MRRLPSFTVVERRETAGDHRSGVKVDLSDAWVSFQYFGRRADPVVDLFDSGKGTISQPYLILWILYQRAAGEKPMVRRKER